MTNDIIGNPDFENDCIIIERKDFDEWKTAIGSILTFSYLTGKEKFIQLICDTDVEQDEKDTVLDIIKGLHINCCCIDRNKINPYFWSSYLTKDELKKYVKCNDDDLIHMVKKLDIKINMLSSIDQQKIAKIVGIQCDDNMIDNLTLYFSCDTDDELKIDPIQDKSDSIKCCDKNTTEPDNSSKQKTSYDKGNEDSIDNPPKTKKPINLYITKMPDVFINDDKFLLKYFPGIKKFKVFGKLESEVIRDISPEERKILIDDGYMIL